MDLELADRTVVVTGGSSGIGLATVARLLAEGATVVTCARDERRLAAATTDLAAGHPGRLTAVPADVTVRDDIERVMTAAVDGFGGVHGLVNNAGGSRMSTFASTDDDAWRDELTLKFASVILPVRAAGASLAAAADDTGDAAIVNVNAVLARQPEARLVATSAARAGVLNLTRSLATELAPVRVNSVLLGLVDSGQWTRRYEAAVAAGETDLDQAAWAREIAMDRGIVAGRFGRSEEVADMITVLLSPRSSYVTGTSIEVSGGVHRYA